MEEKSELNDIILNKTTGSGGNKKVLVAIATLAVILIVVIVIMNRINSEGTQNLPQAILPPEPDAAAGLITDDPLFEPITIIEESSSSADNLDKIAQKLKEESLLKKEESDKSEAVVIKEDDVIIVEPPKPQPAVKPAKKEPVKTVQPTAVSKGKHYVQVGSFSKYAPNEKFIKSITDNDFSYTYHKISKNGKTINKVLIGPFENEKDARNALKVIHEKIEPGAFITKV